jgi:hypothetical protein
MFEMGDCELSIPKHVGCAFFDEEESSLILGLSRVFITWGLYPVLLTLKHVLG